MSPRALSRPDPWRQIWRIATGNVFLAGSLLAVALYLLILSLVPQFSPESGLMAYWSAQTRFGSATRLLYRMGLFSASDSPFVPLLLSALGFSTLLRAIGHLEALSLSFRDRDSLLQKGPPALAEVGTLFLLCGLLLGRIGGWRVEGLIGETGISVPGRNLTLEMTAAGPRVRPPWAQAYIVGYGPRVTLRAVDSTTGKELSLQQTPRESPYPTFSLCLTPQVPEASLAVLEAGLIVQFQAREFPSSHPAIDVTVFRAPSGELAAATNAGPGSFTLTVDQVQMEINIGTCPLVAVGRDPGFWLKVLGLLLGATGIIGAIAPWRARLRGIRVALAIGTLGLAVATLLTLVTTGLLARSSLHTGFAALWGIGLSGWMLRPPGREEFSAQEEE